MKLAVVGSRKFSDYELLKKELEKEEDVEEIVSGGAKGADTLSEWYAAEKDLPMKIFRPDWDQYGKRAGFVRNKEIVENCDKLIAFWDGESRGTSHSIYMARNLGKEVRIVRYETRYK